MFPSSHLHSPLRAPAAGCAYLLVQLAESPPKKTWSPERHIKDLATVLWFQTSMQITPVSFNLCVTEHLCGRYMYMDLASNVLMPPANVPKPSPVLNLVNSVHVHILIDICFLSLLVLTNIQSFILRFTLSFLPVPWAQDPLEICWEEDEIYFCCLMWVLSKTVHQPFREWIWGNAAENVLLSCLIDCTQWLTGSGIISLSEHQIRCTEPPDLELQSLN